ncbi:hypothetical protein Tco_0712789 [Tanacetum coccineum]
MAEIQFVEDSTKPMTTGRSSEDGGNLEELMVTSAVEKADVRNSVFSEVMIIIDLMSRVIVRQYHACNS